MKKSVRSKLSLFKVGITLFFFVISILAIWDSYLIVGSIHKWKEPFSIALVTLTTLVMGLYFLMVVVLFINLWEFRWKFTLITGLSRFRDSLGWFRWPMVILVAFTPAITILYTSFGFRLNGISFRLVLFIVFTVLISTLISEKRDKPFSWEDFFVSCIIIGSIFVFLKEFIGVVDYPLSLTWSEGNRIWDYSILYGRDLYNHPLDQPIKAYIDRGRQTLWGLPFLLPNVSIVGVRMWSAILFTVPYALLGWMVFHPTKQFRYQWVWLGLWAFIFLNQGPIYTPLILSGILVVGIRRKPIWIAFPLIFIAGYYAQRSRMTWMAAPMMWGILITLLDGEDQNGIRFLKTHWKPIFLYGLAGFLGGFGIIRGWNRLANYFSEAADTKPNIVVNEHVIGNLIDTSDSIEVVSVMGQNSVLIDQPLVWGRLWPNPTYGLGIILGLIFAVGPLIVLLLTLLHSKQWKLNVIQQLGLFGILTGFLGLGIVVSTKIGGGGDLHNLDMFLISLVLVSGLAWERVGKNLLAKIKPESTGLKLVLMFVVVIPAFMPWIDAEPLELPPDEKIQWTMKLLRRETSRVLEEGGEILFMDQRQLLTFGYLGDIPLVPDYEKKLVMDMAMSGNASYFVTFYKDISDQRFELIISDPQRVRYADDTESWGIENDTWVEWVSKPLLCYYEPSFTIKTTSVWLLVPRENPDECDFQ